MRHITSTALIAAALLVLLAGFAQAEPTADTSGAFSVELAADWAQDTTGDGLLDLVGPKEIPHVTVTGDAAEGVTLPLLEKVFVAQAKKEMKGFTLVSKGRTKLGTVSAGVWVYKAKVEGMVLQFKNCVVFRGDKMYNIVFATLPELYKTDVKGFDTMMKSWAWL